MFFFTARLRPRRIAAVLAAAAALCLLAAVAVHPHLPGTAASATGPSRVSTNEDRVAYLNSWGWQVAPEPVTVEELVIPKEFDDTYTQYLQLQADQGFDLRKYAGKRVKRYTYTVTNYPTGEQNILAGLLIWRSRVVGGDVLSTQADGFLHGLAMPE